MIETIIQLIVIGVTIVGVTGFIGFWAVAFLYFFGVIGLEEELFSDPLFDDDYYYDRKVYKAYCRRKNFEKRLNQSINLAVEITYCLLEEENYGQETEERWTFKR